MTLASETNRVSYSGDGSTVSFPITFAFWANADIRAVLRSAAGAETLWVLGTHYTLSGGSGSTGTLTVSTSPTDYTPASGTTLVIKSARALTQSLDLPSGGALPSTSVEQQFDILTRLVQQLNEKVNRALLLAETSSYSSLTMPDPVAAYFLRWKADLSGLENAETTGSGSIGIPVSVAQGGTGGTTAAAGRDGLGFSGAGRGMSMINGTLQASVGSNALTISIKTLAGTDPSTTDPVLVLFRSATAATADYTVITITAATSLVISSGSTLGALSATAFRLWIVGFNDAGTFRLGVINALRVGTTPVDGGLNVHSFHIWPIASSTAEGGAGAADNPHVFYTGTAVTSKPFAILGYASWEVGLTTAGTWDAVPTRLHLFDGNTPLPGQQLEVNADALLTATTGTSVIPDDDTVPEITEGDAVFIAGPSCRSRANIWLVEGIVYVSHSAGGPVVFTVNDGVETFAVGRSASAGLSPITIRTLRRISSLTEINGRIGVSAAGTWTLNGSAGSRRYGGTMVSGLSVREIMA